MVYRTESFFDFALANKVVEIKPTTLRSGRKSNLYINWRSICEDAYLTNLLASQIIEYAIDKGISPTCFVGVPEGATKLGIKTQDKWARSSTGYGIGSHTLPMIRAKIKDHGNPKDHYFLGVPRNNSLIIEDVTTTADSLCEIIEKFNNSNITGTKALALTDRSSGEAAKRLSTYDVPFYAMSTAEEILPKAIQRLELPEKILEELRKEFPNAEI
jgi:orotate phosphoribosyltransferase